MNDQDTQHRSGHPMRYRKKPVVIEALQFTRESLKECCDFLGNDLEEWGMDSDDRGCYLLIRTLEGSHRASLGDYLIRGVKGEMYPCKPDVFKMTYDPVEGVSAEAQKG